MVRNLYRSPLQFSNDMDPAPLALRAAKQAISRSEDLPLETGEQCATPL